MTQVYARPATAADVVVDLTAVPEVEEAETRDFERYSAERDAGTLDEEDFRRIRLCNGIYGIRGETRLQMVRVKVPQGVVTAEGLRVMAKIADEKSRGFGHITTRQNLQFHLVRIEEVPTVMRWVASVGLTTREACGDTVRNVAACHLAGGCPEEILDVTAWGQAVTDHFLRNPIAQRLPRKFKINFSGCVQDCGQGAINDVGVIAVRHPETGEAGFRIILGGGLGPTPHEALPLEDFTRPEDVLITVEAVMRVFDREGERKNRNRARLKWLVDKIGIDALREKVVAERRAVIAVSGVNAGIPDVVARVDAHLPARPAGAPAALPQPNGNAAFARWVETNVVVTRDGLTAAYVTLPLGDVTAAQFLGLADVVEDFGSDCRTTNRQNFVLRGIPGGRLGELFARLDAVGLGEADAHAAADPVSCPGADTCNLAMTQSRGLARAIRSGLQDAGLGTAPVRINISGCSNSCGQHHLADVGFFGMERRLHERSAPGYQTLVGGGIGDAGAVFGRKVGKLPAKRIPEAVVALVARFETEREAGEDFRSWSGRAGTDALGAALAAFDNVPDYDTDPEAYVDWDETGAYEVQLGQGECA